MEVGLGHKSPKMVIRKCHKCGQLVEAPKEQESCACCGKSFLPLNYFEKVHDHSGKLTELYAESDEIAEEDLVKGIFVIW